MEPAEFLDRGGFESLDADERPAYLARFMAALKVALETAPASRQLAFISHYLDISEWTMPPEEFDQVVRSRLWEAMWENAETALAVLDCAVESDDPEWGAWAAANVESVRAIVDHKRALEELPEAG